MICLYSHSTAKIVGLPTSIKQISTEPEVIPGKTVILVAEMINMTTAFVVWQPYPSHLVTGYEVVIHALLNYLTLMPFTFRLC